MKTETEPNPDAICAHCGQKYSKHIHEETRGEKRIYCFYNTNGDLWSTEPGWEEIGTLIEAQQPELWASLTEKWKQQNGHLPALPAPQPGGGGEAGGCSDGTCGRKTCRVCDEKGHIHAPVAPIALPVRAEAGTPRVDAMKFWALTSGIIRGSIEVVKVEDAQTLERELNRQSDIAEKQLHKAASLETQTAALLRELEEGREGRADFIKLLASTLGVETDRQDYIVMHIQSLRAELEEAKAGRDHLTELSVAAMTIAEEPRELWDIPNGPSCPMIEAVKKLRNESDALRAAPRSEGDETRKALVLVRGALKDYIDGLESVLQGNRPEKEPAELVNRAQEAIAIADHVLATTRLAPRSETEGRDKERWRPIETAPKDGRPILLAHSQYVTVGYIDFDGQPRCSVIGNFTTAPTHWMPKPPPPALAHDEKGAGEGAKIHPDQFDANTL